MHYCTRLFKRIFLHSFIIRRRKLFVISSDMKMEFWQLFEVKTILKKKVSTQMVWMLHWILEKFWLLKSGKIRIDIVVSWYRIYRNSFILFLTWWTLFYSSNRCELGTENDLRKCSWQSTSNLQCNLNKDVVGIQCIAPEIALCDGNSTPFRDKCYEVRLKSNWNISILVYQIFVHFS